MHGAAGGGQTRERVVVIASLAAITLLAWAWVVRLGAGMDAMSAAGGMAGMSGMEGGAGSLGMSGMGDTTGIVDMSGMTGMDAAGAGAVHVAMPHMQAWGAAEVVSTFAMWAVMMVAMMTPTAGPMLVTYDGLVRRSAARAVAMQRALAFLLGYMVVWTVFSAGATLLQWALSGAGLLLGDADMVVPLAGGALLVAAGIYQFTPLKHVCLARCSTPLSFLMTEWRDGDAGALRMGLLHGVHCVGCCWALMLLLFVAGVMNLVWVALIAAYVLVEKAVPGGRFAARPLGAVLIIWGGWLIATTLRA